jgi:hypothetical protein
MSTESIPANPFDGPDNGLHVHRVTLFYTVEGSNEEWQLSFDLDDNNERRIGSIYFDRPDVLRALGFEIPAMQYIHPTEGPEEPIPGMARPERTGAAAEVSSAREVYVHEERTCNWMYAR